MKYLASVLVACVLLSPAAITQSPTPAPVVSVFKSPAIALADKYEGAVGDFVKVSPVTEGEIVRFVAVTPGLNIFPSDMLRDPKSTVVTASKAGSYRLLAYTAAGGVPSEPAYTNVIIGGEVNPPGPGPGPGPVDPPTPTPTNELRVLILYETNKAYPIPVMNAINSTVVREWLNTNTVTTSDVPKGWYAWDDDYTAEDLARLPKWWQEAYAAVKPKIIKDTDSEPKANVIIFRGQVADVYSFVDTNSLLELLKKYK